MKRTLLPLAFLLPSLATAGTVGEVYGDLEASITAPDSATPEEGFDVEAAGAIVGGSSWDVYSYELYENATWSYDSSHMVSVSSGDLIESSGFNWGNAFSGTWTMTPEEGTHTYLFVMGYRSSAHAWYDLAVELEVAVASEPEICAFFRRPGPQDIAAGRNLPIRFTAIDCDSGALVADQGVEVSVYDRDGVEVEYWTVATNPIDGVMIRQDYLVNWRTDSASSGIHIINVRFSDGDELWKVVRLR